MSAPPRADFVAGCPDCGQSKEADSLEVVADFYACHHCDGHDVEWMWGDAEGEDVEVEVADDGSVGNLLLVIDALETVFRPACVPAELLFEVCLNAGATKQAVQSQMDDLPASTADRVGSLD